MHNFRANKDICFDIEIVGDVGAVEQLDGSPCQAQSEDVYQSNVASETPLAPIIMNEALHLDLDLYKVNKSLRNNPNPRILIQFYSVTYKGQDISDRKKIDSGEDFDAAQEELGMFSPQKKFFFFLLSGIGSNYKLK